MEIKIKWIKRKQMTHENTYRDDNCAFLVMSCDHCYHHVKYEEKQIWWLVIMIYFLRYMWNCMKSYYCTLKNNIYHDRILQTESRQWQYWPENTINQRRWNMIHFPYNRLNVLDISHISPIIFKLWMFDRNLCHFNLHLFYLRSQIALTA